MVICVQAGLSPQITIDKPACSNRSIGKRKIRLWSFLFFPLGSLFSSLDFLLGFFLSAYLFNVLHARRAIGKRKPQEVGETKWTEAVLCRYGRRLLFADLRMKM